MQRIVFAENVLLICLFKVGKKDYEIEDDIEELKELCRTANCKVEHIIVKKIFNIIPATYIGKGKLQQISYLIKQKNISAVIFNVSLSGSQIKNIEDIIKCRVIDKNELILAIFAKRAKTNEAKIQVELAQYQYLLPRLKRMWPHLSRQTAGGVGLRGPGEKQLEIDKRKIHKHITTLKNKINKIKKIRKTQTKQRINVFQVSLIGYTSAGKSTLLNALTKQNIYTDDMLFSTLDTTTRKVYYNHNNYFLLSDTVGFIKDLPDILVSSFMATLEEIKKSDLLLQVIDISKPNWKERMYSVNKILKKIECENIKRILVFNKWDLKNYDETILLDMNLENQDYIFISALKKKNINILLKKIIKYI